MKRSKKFKYRIAQYAEDLPKPKKNEVVIIPLDNRITQNPPILASEYRAEWFDNLPKGRHSLRRCSGTLDYLQYGFIIKAWSDFIIRPSINGTTVEARVTQIPENNKPFNVDFFGYQSTGKCPFTQDRLLPEADFPKFVSPWRYITPKGISLMALPVWHEQVPEYSIVPGIVHTDYYHQVHVVLNVYTDKEFIIPEGTAIQHMVPIHRNGSINKILLGNESMFKFLSVSGTTKKNSITIDAENKNVSQHYRRNLRENDV